MIFQIKRHKSILLILFLFNIVFSYSANDNLTQTPPKYNVLLNKYEYLVLISSIENGLLKYSGAIDYNIKISNIHGEIVWELTTTNKTVVEVISVYVAQKSVNILTEINNRKTFDNELINAVSSLAIKLESAINNPIYSLQTLVGIVKLENNRCYLVSTNGDKRMIQDFCNDMTTIIDKPLVVEGYIKNEGFIIAEKYRFIKKDTLELFVMSQCPYGINALKHIIKNDSLLSENNIKYDIRFIFYKDGNTFVSLHGEPEIQENLVMIIIRDKYSDKFKSYLSFRINRPNDTWQDIALVSGLKEKEICSIEKMILTDREKLIETEYEYTSKKYNNINASPTYAWESVIINSLMEISTFIKDLGLYDTQKCGNF